MRSLCLLLGIFSYIQSFEHEFLSNFERRNETECGCFEPSGRYAAPSIACVRALAWMASNMRPPRVELLAACVVAAKSIGDTTDGWKNSVIAFLLESSGYHRSGDGAFSALR